MHLRKEQKLRGFKWVPQGPSPSKCLGQDSKLGLSDGFSMILSYLSLLLLLWVWGGARPLSPERPPDRILFYFTYCLWSQLVTKWAKSRVWEQTFRRKSHTKKGRKKGKKGRREGGSKRRKEERRMEGGRKGRKEAAFSCFGHSDSVRYFQLAHQWRGRRPWQLVELITITHKAYVLWRGVLTAPFSPQRKGIFCSHGRAHVRIFNKECITDLMKKSHAPTRRVTPKGRGESKNKM